MSNGWGDAFVTSKTAVTQKQPRGILKIRSRYPKPNSAEDERPTLLIVPGVQVALTRDKYGKVIPFSSSFWFANREYEKNAQEATLLQNVRRKRRREEAEAEGLKLMKHVSSPKEAMPFVGDSLAISGVVCDTITV